ncbi:alpha-L-fucosidase [Candidatus Litorirhabdus singularis]
MRDFYRFFSSLRQPLLIAVFSAFILPGCSSETPPALERSRQMPEWFEDAKLGIFIHWGLPSVPAYAAGEAFEPGELERQVLLGRGSYEIPYAEWYLFSLQDRNGKTRAWHNEHWGENSPYQAFKPIYEQRVADNWKPAEWAQLFSDFGARYVVLVSKHHDGYTLWPSAVPNPHQDNWFNKQDIVGELADAVRAKGMKYGLYYSTGLDWTFELSADGDFFTNFLKSAPQGQDYGDYTNGHLRELITNYRPAVIWADIGYPSRGDRDALLLDYFEQVPDGVINDRWEAFDFLGRVAAWPGGAWLLKKLAVWSVQRETDPLQDVATRFGFKTSEYANLPGIAPFKWESTRGLGGSFGFQQLETAADMLSGEALVHYVIDTVSKNGNVLINVGPDSYGQIPSIQQRPLLELGGWLKINGEAIYGTRPWDIFGGLTAEGQSLRYTRKDNTLYAMLLAAPTGKITLTEVLPEVSAVELLGYGAVDYKKVTTGLQIQLPAEALPLQPAYTFAFTIE